MPLNFLRLTMQRGMSVNIALIVLLLMSVAMAGTEFKILTLQHRFAQDMIESIRPFVGTYGSAAAIQKQLIILAAP
jgi:hypothetical protein